MANTFEWNFGPVDIIDEGGNPSVAKVVHWQCTGISDVEGVAPVRHIGTVSLGEPGEVFEDIIAYGEEGCQEQRLAWVSDAEPDLVAETEERIAEHLSERESELAANKQTLA